MSPQSVSLQPADLSGLGHVHVVGIGGAGMSGIARILVARGVTVSGSDAKDSRRIAALRALGVEVHVGHDAAHLGDTDTVMVDDRAGRAAPTIVPQSGDRAASWIRWIHEGSHSGPVWMVIVFLTGVFPTIFAITGIIMWLRKRADRKSIKAGAAQLRPAE